MNFLVGMTAKQWEERFGYFKFDKVNQTQKEPSKQEWLKSNFDKKHKREYL